MQNESWQTENKASVNKLRYTLEIPNILYVFMSLAGINCSCFMSIINEIKYLP